MTKLLNSAFEEISKLPEIESEKKWEKEVSNSEDLLLQYFCKYSSK